MGKGKNRATSHPIPVQPANKLDQGNSSRRSCERLNATSVGSNASPTGSDGSLVTL